MLKSTRSMEERLTTMWRNPLVLGVLILGSLSVRATAGTTGGLNGIVTDEKTHAPLAGAKITAASPSQFSQVMTDAKGHYAFLSLAPDAYVVASEKEGYRAFIVSGISITADQQLSLDLTPTTRL
jgi:hypothetical protein